MFKLFFNNRCLRLSSSYKECFEPLGSIVYLLQSIEDLPSIVDEFKTNDRLVNFCIYTNGISEKLAFDEIGKCFAKITAAGGLVRNAKNEILMIHRFGYWDLPKGKHEDYETIEETAIREVEEECGIGDLELSAPITKTYHIYSQNNSWFLKETHWFEFLYKKEEQLKPQREEGIEEVRWIPAAELPAYLSKAYASIKEVFKATKSR